MMHERPRVEVIPAPDHPKNRLKRFVGKLIDIFEPIADPKSLDAGRRKFTGKDIVNNPLGPHGEL